MSRGQGRVYLQPGSKNWFYDFSVEGKRYQASTKTPEKRAANAILTEERAKALKGGAPGQASRKVALHDLRARAEKQYELDGRRSLGRYKRAWDHVERLIPPDTRVSLLTAIRRDDYAGKRLAEGASRATVNYELGALRRGERLAVEKGMIGGALFYRLPKVRNARQGFFEDSDLAAMLIELPEYIRPVVELAYYTGWRTNSDILSMTWDQVDWEGKVLRIWATTKTGQRVTLPFCYAPPVEALLKAQWEKRDGLFVFHRNGKRILDFSTTWENAGRRAGVKRLVHDFCRTAMRNYRRAGVAENVILDLVGRKTRDVFDRYDIRNEKDLAEAVGRRFNGRVAGYSGVGEGERAEVS
jgi:integrase